ncbi:MAG: flagellar biosynthesis protein FlhA [Zetaproteobacteria bacterium]|nr:flagellar biosynthesis protein FlhA [Zetaproteobacteria bacterium]
MAATTTPTEKFPLLEVLKSSDIQFALGLICIIMMMFVPLPSIALDFLLAMSITLGFLALLISIYIKDPLEFSTFPTFLLLATLFRLSLNVATTRNILLTGADGEVSQIIASFGNFVVGGNYFVGFVIFLILVIINFLVITKGAGRVAEVGARFTLDALPGKQMAIDADLNAGIIDRDTAIQRRTKIEQESDFYGSMDGASKFVRGDAIAGILITGINIVVGLAVGVMQHNMSFARAAEVYTLLTVGDGLVSQIPSIIISVAAGIVVTRASGQSQLSHQLTDQIVLHPNALKVCSALLFVMGLVPGLPILLFTALAVAFFYAGKKAEEMIKEQEIKQKKEAQESSETESTENIENLLHVDTLTLEVGVGLIPFVDTDQDGEILERIVSARKQFVQEMGIIVPMVMVRDNIQLASGEYRILLKGEHITGGQLMPDHELAMAADTEVEEIEGHKTKEPAYGLDAYWITSAAKEEASFKGYTVVNCPTVIVTHLTKIIGEHSAELLGRQEVQTLVDRVKEKAPKVVEEVLSSENIGLGGLVKVLQNLVEESVSIRDLITILETVADHGREVSQPDALTRYVRKALGRNITSRLLDPQNTLQVVTLERGLEDQLVSGLVQHENGLTSLNLDPQFAQRFLEACAHGLSIFDTTGTVPTLLCGSQLRWDLNKLVTRFIPGIKIISFEEVPKDLKTNNLKVIEMI